MNQKFAHITFALHNKVNSQMNIRACIYICMEVKWDRSVFQIPTLLLHRQMFCFVSLFV